MLEQLRTPNPRYPDSPSRMADGRLFTDYRANCSLLTPHPKGSPAFGASFEDKQRMQKRGSMLMHTDRTLTTARAGSMSCVDTMVPELTKRVCGWNGCTTMPAHAAGIGQGRLYLPGRTDLVAGDPDVLAAATAFTHGTFPSNPNLYIAGPDHGLVALQQQQATPAYKNRYSVPYGN
jgi:hypothetical protein